MRKKKHTGLLILFLSVTSFCLAQNYSTTSKKAIRRFEEARSCFELMDDACVEEALLKAIKADPGFKEAYQLMAQLKFDRGDKEQAINYYSKSLELDPAGNPDGYRLLAGLTIQVGDYQRTMELIDIFLEFPPQEVRKREEGLLLKEKCRFALEAMEDPVPFQAKNLGEAINSEYNEYWPSLSVDEQMLMFTVLVPMDSGEGEKNRRLQEDFYYSRVSGEAWKPRSNAGRPLNTLDNEGAHCMTADGKTLFFTACNRRDGRGMCDIYQSTWTEGNWSVPKNLGTPVNSRYSEKHPSISADGRKLYFTSNRPGGLGSYDIWLSERVGDSWSKPVNLGDSVNTPLLEQSPFIHPDQQSLYFSSNGWPGMGQSDLFLSRLGADAHWTEPQNLGYPINTHNDEMGLSVNARGDRAYFASDREGGKDTDLYSFELPLDIRPVLVSYLAGRVYDSRTNKGLRARMQLLDLGTEELVMELESHAGQGDYLLSLPTDRNYALNVSADGYLFFSGHFSFTGQHELNDPMRRDIALDPIREGSSVVLQNVFFETDSHVLQAESLAELNKVHLFLEQNPTIHVEISGHTDATGSPEHNQILSEQRAQSVVDYLLQKGAEKSRLVPKGYGETLPLADNQTEEGRKRNRRTEFKILQH